ncbi:MAG: ABC transporter permease, partial [Bacteroidota bacterium]
MLKRYMYRFFRWYCNPAYFEDIEGDLEEIFQQQLENGSRRSAEWQYTREVLLLFRPTIIRPIRFINLQHMLSMFQNYLKIGLRNLLKYRTNTAIHIWGLAIGLAAFLLINQYVTFERSYDRFHDHADHIYRLTTDVLDDGQLQLRDAMTYAPAAKTLEEALPEVINSTTTLKIMEVNFRRKGRPIQEDMIAVDTQFLKIFNYPLLAGDPNDLLEKPNSLVLTAAHAKKYFGQENPIGQSIEFLSGKPGEQFVVRGVVAD